MAHGNPLEVPNKNPSSEIAGATSGASTMARGV